MTQHDDIESTKQLEALSEKSIEPEESSTASIFDGDSMLADVIKPEDQEAFEDLLEDEEETSAVERFFDTDDEDREGGTVHPGDSDDSQDISVNYERLPLKTEIEACLFASPSPLKVEEIMGLCSYEEPKSKYFEILTEIQSDFEERQCGFKLKDLKALGFQFQTEESSAYLMAKIFSQRPKPISKAALETLAILAYRQPCTRAVVEYIRGVDSGSIIKNLMDRNLIRCVGRREDAGRPMLFGTTDEFLNVFDLRSLGDLPSLGSFQANSDTLKKALEDLEQLEEVDVDSFVSDDSEELPEISTGLLETDEPGLDLGIDPDATPLVESPTLKIDMSENEA